MNGGGTARAALVTAAALFAATFSTSSRATTSGVTAADDAYHYREWAGSVHDVNYTEWWNFNLFDSEHNLQAIFTYFIADPANLAGIGQSQLTAVAYTPAGIVSVNDLYAPDA